MKKGLKKIIISIIFLLAICFPFITSLADSGFDGSYDSGSSSSSWSSSSSSSSSYYSNTSNKMSNTISIVMFLVVIVLVDCLIASHLLKTDPIQSKDLDSMLAYKNPNMKPYNFEELQKLLSDFDENNFKNYVFELYKKIQIAWMNFDNETLKKCTTDELYNTYNVQLQGLKVKQQQNIMDEFTLESINISGMEIGTTTISLAVNIRLTCLDYIIDANGNPVRGNKDKKVTYEYLMIFTRSLSSKPNKCPNCGADLNNVNSSTCEYCRANLINENYDWVLSKKQILYQTINRKQN